MSDSNNDFPGDQSGDRPKRAENKDNSASYFDKKERSNNYSDRPKRDGDSKSFSDSPRRNSDNRGGRDSFSPRPRRDDDGERGERRSFSKGPRKEGGSFGDRKPFSGGPRRESGSFGDRKPFSPRPRRDDDGDSSAEGSSYTPRPRRDNDRDSGERRSFSKGPRREGGSFGDRKPFSGGPRREGGSFGDRKPFSPRPRRDDDGDSSAERSSYTPRPRRDDDGERSEKRSFSKGPRRESGSFGDRKPFSPRPRRDDDGDSSAEGSSFTPRPRRDDDGERGERRSFSKGPSIEGGNFSDRKPFSGGPRREGGSFGERKPYNPRPRRDDDGESSAEGSSFTPRPRREDNDNRADRGDSRSFSRGPRRDSGSFGDKKPFSPRPRRDDEGEERAEKRTFSPRPRKDDAVEGNGAGGGYASSERRKYPNKRIKNDDVELGETVKSKEPSDIMPVNKYIAHCGICSRRDAALLVKEGKVTVNGEPIADPGFKVNIKDVVTLDGNKLVIQKKLIYVLLNKPKDYITTTDDEKGRKTVMELVDGASDERIFPVGRLDRNTTGLLLLTNDGVLAQRLTHPSFKVKKLYHVTLDKPLTKADFDKVIDGVTLEDGVAIVDELSYIVEENKENRKELGIMIHSGKNRIVRRIFESLQYQVEKLDRVIYAGLTKKNIPRGKWRFLSPHEIVLLKHFKS